ncbi:MAG: hypothetical protein R3C52_10610 [Hyphomonadaceae bacterium]
MNAMQRVGSSLAAFAAACILSSASTAAPTPQEADARAQWQRFAQLYNAYTAMSLVNERCGFLTTEEHAFAKARASDMARDLIRANALNTTQHYQQMYDQVATHSDPCGELVPSYLASPALSDLRNEVQTYLLAWSIAGIPDDCSEWITEEHTRAVMARGESLAETRGVDPKKIPPIAALGEQIRQDCANGAVTGASAAGALAEGHLLQARTSALGYDNAVMLGVGIVGLHGRGSIDGLPWAAVAWERQEEFEAGRDKRKGDGESDYRIGFLQDGRFALWMRLTKDAVHEPIGPASRHFESGDWTRASELEPDTSQRVFVLSDEKSEFLKDTQDYDFLNFRLVREGRNIAAPADLSLRQLQTALEYASAPEPSKAAQR